MNLQRDARGDFLFESADLASRFGISITQLRRLMRLGLVTSSVETGEGEHQGTSRLRLRCGNRVWSAIVDAHDHVASEEIFVARASKAPKSMGSIG